ncbi:hypothetical protein FKM82_012137 [Ascaphus truei]
MLVQVQILYGVHICVCVCVCVCTVCVCVYVCVAVYPPLPPPWQWSRHVGGFSGCVGHVAVGAAGRGPVVQDFLRGLETAWSVLTEPAKGDSQAPPD